MGHGEGLARSGDAQQNLVALAPPQAGDQFIDRLGLIARRLEIRDHAQGLAALDGGALGRIEGYVVGHRREFLINAPL